MKTPNNNEVLAENKVLLLYILDNLNKPVTNDELYSIVSSSVDLNYFVFQQILIDLIKAKYVMCYTNENKKLYQLSDSGKNTLALTIDILPGIVKLQVDTNFKDKIENIKNENSITAEYIPKSENEYEILCKVIENNESIFEIKTFAYSREQAQKIVDNWKNNANKLYPKIINLLTE